MRRVGWKTQALIPSVPQGGLQPYPDTAGPPGLGLDLLPPAQCASSAEPDSSRVHA